MSMGGSEVVEVAAEGPLQLELHSLVGHRLGDTLKLPLQAELLGSRAASSMGASTRAGFSAEPSAGRWAARPCRRDRLRAVNRFATSVAKLTSGMT